MRPKENILTFYKHDFSPLNAKESDIDICDIAHALSLLCRANGHFTHFFSVAQHSLNCCYEASARNLPENIRKACLLHDASEAYISDITRPVKLALPEYLTIEVKLQTTICRALNVTLTEDENSYVKAIDDAMLYHEFVALAGEHLFPNVPEIVAAPDFTERKPLDVEQEFLKCYKELSR